ncbi:MAG TPA: hypothetical protein VFU98_18450 [Microlunatus sp.]|nr:hypothetical protein [Microlunatus sp.]
MIRNPWFRRIHRWVAVVFVASVVAVTVVVATQPEPAAWIYLSPLLPLGLLVVTGAVMFVQPYLARGRSLRRA